MKKISTVFAFILCLVNGLQAQIVISEIMYNPPEAGSDTLEYLELANPTAAAVNLEGWSLSGVDLVFATGVQIPAGGYLLTAFRASAMQTIFGKTAIQWTSGALTNSGETLKILNNQGVVVDEVAYDDAAPWPTDPAGNGNSLELCNLLADNSIAINWKAANKNTGVVINAKPVFATPGAANTVSCLPAADHQISAQDFFFAPADVTINQGESIIWVNLGGTHNVNGSLATFPQNPEGFFSGAPTAAPWFFIDTFDVPGIYSYRCDAHFAQGMNGKVTVLAAALPKIVISEIMYNDPGVDSLEYIELTNVGSEAVNVSGWSFSQGIDYVFPANSTMAVGEILTIAKYPAYFNSYFGFTPTHVFTGALTNTGEDLELRNTQNEVMDYVDYLPTAPWPVEPNGGGQSLVLCSLTGDNNVGTNWMPASTPTGFQINAKDILANPGMPSGCPTNITTQNDVASVPSGGTVNVNVLVNDFIPNPAGTTLIISVQPLHGTASVNADKTVKYVSTAGFCGKDVLTYSVTDGGTTATGTVEITVKCYPKLNIQDVIGIDGNGKADSLGVSCELEAVVYGVNIRPTGLSFTIIDGSNNGLFIFRNTGNLGYVVNEGDKIRVFGVIDQFNGLTQMAVDSVIKGSANNTLVNPLTVVKHTEGTENKLIKINNLSLVNPAAWTTGVGTSGFTVRAVAPANPNDTISIRIDNDVTIFNEPVPIFPFNLTGLGGQFDQTSPFSSGYQISPRYVADLQLIVGTAEADFSGNVKISPNPTAEMLYIRTDKSFDNIQIASPDGRILRTLIEPDLEEAIDFQSFGSGVYFVKFELDGKFWVTRVVKI